MTEGDSQEPHKNPSGYAGHPAVQRNIDDLNVWAVVKFAIGLLVLGIVSYVVLYGLLKLFEHQEVASQAPAPRMQRGPADRLPPPPRLQMMPGNPSDFTTPDAEMRAMLAEQNKTLNSYGWVNKDAGVVRISIDEAMKLVIQKGLPAKPAAAARAASTHAASAAGGGAAASR